MFADTGSCELAAALETSSLIYPPISRPVGYHELLYLRHMSKRQRHGSRCLHRQGYWRPSYAELRRQPYRNSGSSMCLLFLLPSDTWMQASGPINKADTTIAGITLADHPYAAVDFTNSTIVGPGVPTSGILGLSFPTASQVQTQAAIKELGNSFTIDKFVQSTSSLGPLLTRMALSGQLDQPMFSVRS
jgi:hypothetical protein